MPRVVDLFAGGGGLSLGLQQAGFDVVAAVENWSPAVEVYRANFADHPVLQLDLNDVDAACVALQAVKPDVIAGGPPCQDFSSAGKRDESLGRASLTISFAEIVTRCRPAFFIMENVERAAKSETYKNALSLFRAAGYGISIRVLDASHCGAPQLRKRLIVIGSLNDRDGFLDLALHSNLSAEPMTVRQYFRNRLPLEHYYRHRQYHCAYQRKRDCDIQCFSYAVITGHVQASCEYWPEQRNDPSVEQRDWKTILPA